MNNPGDTSAGPEPTTIINVSLRGRFSANANPPADINTDRLMPAEQQTRTGTSARKNVATVSVANRKSHAGLSSPSHSGKRQRINSRGSTAKGSLAANSTTATTPAAITACESRRSPEFPIHKARPSTFRISSSFIFSRAKSDSVCSHSKKKRDACVESLPC